MNNSYNYLKRVVSLCCLSGEHDAVGAIKDSVGHVRGLGSCRARLLHHRLEHLGGANHALTGLVALGNDLDVNRKTDSN